MTQEERWAFAVSWVGGHSRKICGYVCNHYLLDYSAYEMQDFLAEAYLIAYEAADIGGDAPVEGCFWTLFKNRCKVTLANKPHYTKETDIAALYKALAWEQVTSLDPLPLLKKMLIHLSPCQREVIELIVHADKPLAISNIAEILSISQQAVRQRLAGSLKAICGLRKILI